MNEKRPDIIITCIKGCFQDYEIEKAESEMETYDLDLKIYQDAEHRFCNASIDLFVPIMQILLSPDFLVALEQGIVTNAAYDGVKHLLNSVRKMFCKRNVYKIESNSVRTEEPNIQFVIGDKHLILPVDVDDNKFEYAVDAFMDRAFEADNCEPTYVFYQDDESELKERTRSDIIREEIEKHISKKDIK